MTNYKSGDVCLLPFPFTSLQSTKKRPGLIITTIPSNSLPKLCVVAMITSKLKSENIPGDYQIKDWEHAGLPLASKLRFAKITTMEESLIFKKLGTLSLKDQKGAHKAFREIFKHFLRT